MRVHFIAIGGSAMHNLAIALYHKGFNITGSDDEIFEPSRTRLTNLSLLPEKEGWFPEKITRQLDAVILGMHAKADNPELIRAQELGLKIYSYPEYLYEQSADKTRVVIGGSHGKTTITAMILHVLQHCDIETDYMVGAKLEGFDVMVKLTHSARVMVFEGDEYLTSPIDRRPKFHLYRPHIALLSGIAWDHMNVFPTFENYVWQFERFCELIEPGGKLVWYSGDEHIAGIVPKLRPDIQSLPYSIAEHETVNGITLLTSNSTRTPLMVFGNHNLANIAGARTVCAQLGISDQQFNEAISSFKGASNRLEKIYETNDCIVFRDFAHSPSKVKATTTAVKEQFPDRQITAIFELHTFSSLSEAFLPQYKDALVKADEAVVFFSPHALALKRLPMLNARQITQAFNHPGLKVMTQADELQTWLTGRSWHNTALLLMTSGNFDGISPARFVEIVRNQTAE
ncbi:MAG TPA: peptidoglycan synthetase [Bacteroidales bacterium]|nr:MAG: peptidoglycan synthetase [Bacteroidetes bacterium GWE2_42_24]OFY31612.1 MAG: peptidoglycan synthetase [Bacteroidetes bacterium GWF2_43_11]HAQ64419.1 peptidoglycan synthetase [Bacteroidales bacterium]HBZ67131.1 peptidoglycan synthetase [Bacteroidales bacterium]